MSRLTDSDMKKAKRPAPKKKAPAKRKPAPVRERPIKLPKGNKIPAGIKKVYGFK